MLAQLLQKLQVRTPTPAQPAGTNRRRRRRRNRANVSQPAAAVDNSGTVRVKRVEFLAAVKNPSDDTTVNSYFDMTGKNLTWLSKLVSAFDKIVWHSCVLEYRPYASAMTNGTVAIGTDWDSRQIPNRTRVLGCTPSVETQVSKAVRLSCPSAQLMSRKHYDLSSADGNFDGQPFRLLVSADSNVKGLYYGDIFVHYDVSLLGTSG
uniref:Capsid protein n=1 Tax=Atrato Sobemo-like virus 1 TaxID=2689347 RepID=A0A6B9KU91_9VIRU|nr:putative coat protein [Atrato Sobemo-like virus 1]QHA33897.1 putative coat protein [Atrato Sobemo-like virus 1]